MDNSLVDLEFRFNELVTHEDGDLGTRRESTNTSNNEEKERNADFQKHIVTLIEKLETKVKLMDEKICTIGRISKLFINSLIRFSMNTFCSGYVENKMIKPE